MKPQLFIGLLLGLLVGYFAGREHVKYEIRATFTRAAEGVANAFSGTETKTKGKEVEGKRAEQKQARDYIDRYIKTEDLRVKYEKDAFDTWKPVVRTTLKNTGPREISELKVTAYF